MRHRNYRGEMAERDSKTPRAILDIRASKTHMKCNMLAIMKGPNFDNGFDSMCNSELADPNFNPRYVFMNILIVGAANSKFLLDSAMFIFDIEQQKITHNFGKDPELSTEQIMEMIGEEL